MANSTMVWASLVAYVLLLSGCAVPFGQGRGPRVRLGVALVRQTVDREGGLASARMLARYHRATLPARTERMLRLASSSGELSAAELKAALETSGLKVEIFSGTRDGLYAHLDRGEPVVVLVGASYMLVDGYGGGSVRLLDPRHGALEADAGDFDRVWQDSQRLALVARH
jgi:ABC-type bacteriocin/lantibiotic exporter with double-glycine peptidase domain